VLYWRRARLIAHDYARGHAAEIAPPLAQALHVCASGVTQRTLQVRLGVGRERTQDFIRVLCSHGFLQRSGTGASAGEHAMHALDAWNPAAGLFHDVSRRVTFFSPAAAAAFMRRRARELPMPPVVKRVRGAKAIRLPKPRADGEFPQVLLARRTWRRFASKPVKLDDVATALALSVGVQQWVPTSVGRLPLKTSPSGGARHPIEAYVCASRVSGLAPGLYHYAADVHRLERLKRRVTAKRLAEWMPHSGYFTKAAFLIVFTAVLERETWRYPYARAYRAAIAEAGHVCQTFCLTATWLGLAPFCLMGLDDAAIEADLGLDGVRETVLYVAGAGSRPRGATWAPRPRGGLTAVPNLSFEG
jgi:SagB-type dehydrogenase family enzyme